MPLSYGEAATDAQPTRRQRRRKRGREREKARRAHPALQQATPLTVAEKQLAVARADLLVELLREQGLKQQLTASTHPCHEQPSLPPIPNGQEVVLHTSRENRIPTIELSSSDSDDPPHLSPSRLPPISRGEKVFMNTSREGRVPIIEQFSSDLDDPPHPGSSRLPPTSRGKKVLINTSRENRVPIVEQFSSGFSGNESPEDPNLPTNPSLPLPSILETQESLECTRSQKRAAARGLLSSCVQVPSTQQDTVPSCGPAGKS
jgi:hypothetical protein